MEARPYRRSAPHHRALTIAAILVPLAPTTRYAQQPHDTLVASLPLASEVIQRHITAVGGRAALLKLHSRYVWAGFAFPARQLNGALQVYQARPNKRLVKIEYPDLGTIVTAFDGQLGWTSQTGASPRLIQGKELAQLRDDSVFDFDLHDENAVKSMETLGITTFEGRPCYKLRVVSAASRESTEFYDTATGLFAGSISQRETPKGPVTAWTVVSNYQTVDGVRLPMRVILRSAGVQEVITVRSVEHNTSKVSDAIFEPPAQLRQATGR